jgi:IS4 transposase
MIFARIFQPFVQHSPVAVMFRGALENVFAREPLDRLFQETAQKQYADKLLFSTCAELLALVVAQTHKSLNAAYLAQKEKVGVCVQAVYDKLARIEPAVSEALVRSTATRLAGVVRELRAARRQLLPGFDVRIVDGNHLAGTDHRIGELRRTGAAALPGQAMAILDPQLELIEDVIACPDGHANERTLLPQVLAKVQAGQCWVADRNFCTIAFLMGLFQRNATFVIRHHQQLQGRLLGKRRKVGRIDTGMVYAQTLEFEAADGQTRSVRRITIELDHPTRDGETAIHLLTNLPMKISSRRIAKFYRSRWTIENAFQDLATTLRSEIDTLGYPAAALFGFCLGLVLANVLSLIKAALRAAHPKTFRAPQAAGRSRKKRDWLPKVSTYYLAAEISGVYQGMMIAVPAKHWTATFAALTEHELAATLRWLAKRADASRFRTNRWTPKRPQAKRRSGHRGNHVSTYRVLQESRGSAP